MGKIGFFVSPIFDECFLCCGNFSLSHLAEQSNCFARSAHVLIDWSQINASRINSHPVPTMEFRSLLFAVHSLAKSMNYDECEEFGCLRHSHQLICFLPFFLCLERNPRWQQIHLPSVFISHHKHHSHTRSISVRKRPSIITKQPLPPAVTI